MTVSEKQLLANRRNADNSTGPRTPEGKAAVARNALAHGLTAAATVLPHEDLAEFQAFRENLFAALAPADPVQAILADRIVGGAWRLRRAVRVETELFTYLTARAGENGRLAFAALSSAFTLDPVHGGDSIDKLSRYETALHRAFHFDLAAYQRLRADAAPFAPTDANSSPADTDADSSPADTNADSSPADTNADSSPAPVLQIPASRSSLNAPSDPLPPPASKNGFVS